MGKKILIVDNDQNYGVLIAALIRRMGYATLEATSGEGAIDTALAEEPDLVVTNAELPHMNGIELTLRLKRSPKTSSAPVIVYSGVADHKDAALKAGASLFLTKPLSFFEDLKNAIEDVLKTRP
ncbi:MAG: response regulator [Candidatus Binatia bacterium]